MVSRPNFLTSIELRDQAYKIAEPFIRSVSLSVSLSVEVNVFSLNSDTMQKRKFVAGKPIVVEKTDEIFRVLLNAEELRNAPLSAFSAWLELEIAHLLEKSCNNGFHFNFQKQILPLMPVTGSSLNFVRELVEYLCRGLERLSATKMLFHMGKAESQLDYYFYTLIPTESEMHFYKKYEAHNWVRASHLCRKLVEYMGLSWLADQNVGNSPMLKMQWQQQHGYTSEDQKFMEEMAAIAGHHEEGEFSAKLIAQFRLLRDTFLQKKASVTAGLDSTVLN